jgi:hypothetical protein
MHKLKIFNKYAMSFTKNRMNKFFTPNNFSKKFSTVVPTTQQTPQAPPKKVHGNLSDADRIFSNVYRDGDPFIEGALKRVTKL